jgi:hypothetical protein
MEKIHDAEALPKPREVPKGQNAAEMHYIQDAERTRAASDSAEG